MASERRLADELRAALARRPDPDVAAILEQAENQARAEVVARLKQLLIEDLLERALQALPAAPTRELSLALVGVVPAEVHVESELTDVVKVGGLAALVSKLEPGELEDPQVLERRVRAHNDALLAALDAGPVVPIRFGTLFAAKADLAGWLERNERALLAELERLRETVEWALAVTETVAQTEPVGVGSAETYLERRLAQGQAAARRRQELAERTAAWHEHLAATADAAAVLGGDSLLDAVYLVGRSRQADFDGALLDIQGELDSHELESRLTGPWPPFSFVDANLK